MSGLDNHFFLVDRKEADYWEFARFCHNPSGISIHYDLLAYMADTLKWIPSNNPVSARQKGLLPQTGLNFYAATVITKSGSKFLSRVFDSWAEVLSLGSVRLELTGPWAWIEGEPAENGEYSRISFDRNETVSALKAIAAYGKSITEGSDDLYVLHLGV